MPTQTRRLLRGRWLPGPHVDRAFEAYDFPLFSRSNHAGPFDSGPHFPTHCGLEGPMEQACVTGLVRRFLFSVSRERLMLSRGAKAVICNV